MMLIINCFLIKNAKILDVIIKIYHNSLIGILIFESKINIKNDFVKLNTLNF